MPGVCTKSDSLDGAARPDAPSADQAEAAPPAPLRLPLGLVALISCWLILLGGCSGILIVLCTGH